jgi:hypothetical protein
MGKADGLLLLSFLVAWFPVWGILGLRGVVTQKPFLSPCTRHLAVSGILMAWLYFLFDFLLRHGLQTSEGVVGDVAFVILWTVIMAIIAGATPWEYSAYGVTKTSFREGLLASLAKQNMTYEETSRGLRLPAINADLRVTPPGSSWRAGSIDMKQHGFEEVLRDIANGMNEYYRTGTMVEVSMNCFRVRLLLSVLSAAVPALILWFKYAGV